MISKAKGQENGYERKIAKIMKKAGYWLQKPGQPDHKQMRALSIALYNTDVYHNELRYKMMEYLTDSSVLPKLKTSPSDSATWVEEFVLDPDAKRFYKLNFEIFSKMMKLRCKVYYHFQGKFCTEIYFKKSDHTLKIYKTPDDQFLVMLPWKSKKRHMYMRKIALGLLDNIDFSVPSSDKIESPRGSSELKPLKSFINNSNKHLVDFDFNLQRYVKMFTIDEESRNSPDSCYAIGQNSFTSHPNSAINGLNLIKRQDAPLMHSLTDNCPQDQSDNHQPRRGFALSNDGSNKPHSSKLNKDSLQPNSQEGNTGSLNQPLIKRCNSLTSSINASTREPRSNSVFLKPAQTNFANDIDSQSSLFIKINNKNENTRGEELLEDSKERLASTKEFIQLQKIFEYEDPAPSPQETPCAEKNPANHNSQETDSNGKRTAPNDVTNPQHMANESTNDIADGTQSLLLDKELANSLTPRGFEARNFGAEDIDQRRESLQASNNASLTNSFHQSQQKGKALSKCSQQKNAQAAANQYKEKVVDRQYTGNLKFFDQSIQYGFITFYQDGNFHDIFVHEDELVKADLLEKALWAQESGATLHLQFQIANYFGKYKKSKKAVNLQLLCFEQKKPK